jgi:hypothetical protein
MTNLDCSIPDGVFADPISDLRKKDSPVQIEMLLAGNLRFGRKMMVSVRFRRWIMGVGAAISVMVGSALVLAIYVIYIWGYGLGLAIPFAAASMVYGILLASSVRRLLGRSTLFVKLIYVLTLVVPGLSLANEGWLLAGWGILVPFFTMALLYGSLVALYVSEGSTQHRVLGIVFVLLLPLVSAVLSSVWIVWDPLRISDLWDGFLLSIPIVAACSIALVITHHRTAAQAK